jgi:hypothetical protein
LVSLNRLLKNKQIMKKFVWLIAIIVTGISISYAGVEPEVKTSLTGSALTTTTPKPTLETYDAVFFNAGGSLTGTSTSIYSGLVSARNLVWLEINQDAINDCQTDSFSFSLRVVIERKAANGDSIIREYDTLSVNYNKTNGINYKDKHSVVYYGGYYCKVTVTSICDTVLKITTAPPKLL